MAHFLRSERSSNVTNAQSVIEIIAGAKGCRLWSVNLSLAAATATTIGLGRPAAAGITPTTPAQFQAAEGGSDFSLSRLALAWGTSPTAPAQFYKRLSLPATIGATRDWSFPNGIWIPAGGTLVIQNLAANGVLDVDLDISE